MEPEELYGLPLEQFVPERTALARELRGRGEREEAGRVAKLAKPSISAWAVNQLVRTQATAVRELLAAGDGLRAAQEDIVSGRGSPQALREAADREREAVRALAEAAGGLLGATGRGLGAAALERVSETLHAAALDPAAREAVTGGCLTRELRHVGLGAGPSGSGDAAAARHTETRTAQERAARVAVAAREEREAAERAERAAQELTDAQRRHAAAAEALAAAGAALGAARSKAEEAGLAHRRARQALERLERR